LICAKKARLWPEGGIEVGELLRAITTGGRRSFLNSIIAHPLCQAKIRGKYGYL
jgi:hypothetical protein